MRPDAARADRAHDVRAAARGWLRAGAIDAAALTAIEARYVDDRGRLGPIFRFLAFGFTLLAVNACLGLFSVAFDVRSGFGWVAVSWGAVLVVVTEVLTGPLRRADSGMEAATALMAVGYSCLGIAAIASHDFSDHSTVEAFLVVATVLCLLGSARWGFSLLAVGATVCGFLLLARLPAGRVAWMLAAALLTPLLLTASESSRLAPAQRRGCRAGLFLSLVAFYLAVNVASLDGRAVEWLVEFRDAGSPATPGLRSLSILATAVVPLAILGFGVATRRTSFLYAGVLFSAASLVTLRFYVHVAPLWIVLSASGAAALGLALLLRRVLDSGPDEERGGFTAERLFDDPQARRAAEMVAVVASLAPDARSVPEGGGRLEPGGGRFGGGGATGEF